MSCLITPQRHTCVENDNLWCFKAVCRPALDILHRDGHKRARRKAVTAEARLSYVGTARTFLFLAIIAWPVAYSPALALDDFSAGVAAANRGYFEKAAELFTSAIKKDPSSYPAYANRGSVLIRSGHVLRGIEDWHKARELAPPFAYAVFTGDLVQHASRKKTLLHFVLQTELDPEFLASVVMTGAAYTDLGRPESAAVLFRKAIDLTRNPLWKSYFEYWAKSLDQSR